MDGLTAAESWAAVVGDPSPASCTPVATSGAAVGLIEERVQAPIKHAARSSEQIVPSRHRCGMR